PLSRAGADPALVPRGLRALGRRRAGLGGGLAAPGRVPAAPRAAARLAHARLAGRRGGCAHRVPPFREHDRVPHATRRVARARAVPRALERGGRTGAGAVADVRAHAATVRGGLAEARPAALRLGRVPFAF